MKNPWLSTALWVATLVASILGWDLVIKPKVLPPSPPGPPSVVVASDPEHVYVYDKDWVRTSDAALESVAGKFGVGVWHVHGVPKRGDKGFTRTITVVESSPVPPVPPPLPKPDPPFPPGPVPPVVPPVPVGHLDIAVIHESGQANPKVDGLIVELQDNLAFHVDLKAKGHKLTVLEPDGKDENNQPAKEVEALRPFFQGHQLPLLLIVDRASKKLLVRQPLPATVAGVTSLIRAAGG